MAATAAVYNRLHNSSLGGVMGHQLARSLERILEEAHHSGELNLTNRKLKEFPKTGSTKYNLVDTVIADLSRNRFCELPEEITSFSFLETLLLYHNTIRSIPESVKQLTSLTYLDLRSNQLSALPREICFLPLQVLLVSNNRLASLPDELGRMDRLTDLDASYNQLSALPARIGELRSLRSLSLRSNQLMYLPRELTCLTLISLDVSNNRIASLPLEIRQMTTLVEFNLENNPLTSPPASLCIRGLVHVFKFLETQATKDEKGSRAGGNYDGYTTLRRAPRHNSSGNVLESNRVPRHNVDSGYSTCDGIDKRWSHDAPGSVKSKNDSPSRKISTTPPASLSAELMDASLTSSTNTIVDEDSISTSAATPAVVVKPLHTESLSATASPTKRNEEQQRQNPSPQPQPTTLHQTINYAHSSSSNGSSPDQEDLLVDLQQQPPNQNGKVDEKLNKNLGNIQTYKEYKEALKQQRNQEISSVYKIKGQKTLYDMSEASNALNSSTATAPSHEEIEVRFNGAQTLPKSIMKNGTSSGSNGLNGSGGSFNGIDDCLVIPKKPIQKVIPSRNTELMSQAKMQTTNDVDKLQPNGDCLLGYVKPNSPLKAAANGAAGGCAGILTNNNIFGAVSTSSGLKSPVSSTNKLATAKAHRTVTWNHDIPPEKLSFTMRREFDRQREETELMTQLRSIIETRLKMTLPEDIASALTDGVILCHLANYVRPRSVASIHVPSPGVSKLTMARCRRNVDNFLEACRKIGVDEELICSCADVVPPSNDDDDAASNNGYNNNINEDNYTMSQQQQQQQNENRKEKRAKLPNPSAVLKTVAALIALDFNPHHQNIRNLQQQHELHLKLQLRRQQLQQQQQEQQQQEQRLSFRERCLLEAEDDEDEQHQEQQQQLTATCTKQQMLQQHASVATNMEFTTNSNFTNFNAKCHFENVVLTQNGNCRRQSDNENVADVAVDEQNDVAAGDDDSQQQHQQGSTSATANSMVSNFFRHAKLKTFQKIKLNLITSHGNNSGNGNSNNNHCSAAVSTTLQTIVETETDVVGGAGGGLYQLINEKPKQEELPLKVSNNIATTTNIAAGNKYKLLELPKQADDVQQSSSGAIVSKRIEFFEHSSSTSPTTISGNESVAAAAATTTTSNAKSKAMNNIFSIYRVANTIAVDGDNNKLIKNCTEKAQPEKAGGGSSLLMLRHDSHVLTMILSCVFIVTFLLLVFFPLPG